MFKKLLSRISRGKDWYHTYHKEIKLASNNKVKNQLLYQELEQACKEKGGVLTYAEYLTIDQFGKHGYYATSKQHGKTDVEKRWGDALAVYARKLGHDTIVEFGCGTGELGVATVKAYKKRTKKQLTWFGVEIDKQIHPRILDNFKAHHVQDDKMKIVTALDELPIQHNALIVFPYSLDNIPPHLFINTQPAATYPNAMLGITAQNGRITEVILSPEMLHKKGIKLENGLFTKKGYTSKLSSWKVRKGQRVYIPIDSFITLYQYAKKFGKGTTIVIIDEFRKEPWFFNLGNLGTPRSLYEKNLMCYDRARYYRESGKHNLYYPLYGDSFLKFLNMIGFQSIAYDIEQKKAAELRGRVWFPIRKNYTTSVFFAKDFVEKKITILPIPFSPQRIL